MNDALSARRHDEEPLDEGGTWLLDLVSAVDHLRRGYRPGLTVWDALVEARSDEIRSGGDVDELPAERQQRAVRRWVLTMADRYNAGHHWPHPTSRRAFPPTLTSSEPHT